MTQLLSPPINRYLCHLFHRLRSPVLFQLFSPFDPPLPSLLLFRRANLHASQLGCPPDNLHGNRLDAHLRNQVDYLLVSQLRSPSALQACNQRDCPLDNLLNNPLVNHRVNHRHSHLLFHPASPDRSPQDSRVVNPEHYRLTSPVVNLPCSLVASRSLGRHPLLLSNLGLLPPRNLPYNRLDSHHASRRDNHPCNPRHNLWRHLVCSRLRVHRSSHLINLY